MHTSPDSAAASTRVVTDALIQQLYVTFFQRGITHARKLYERVCLLLLCFSIWYKGKKTSLI